MYDTILLPKTQAGMPSAAKTRKSAKTRCFSLHPNAGMHKSRRIAPGAGACYNKVNFCILWQGGP